MKTFRNIIPIIQWEDLEVRNAYYTLKRFSSMKCLLYSNFFVEIKCLLYSEKKLKYEMPITQLEDFKIKHV